MRPDIITDLFSGPGGWREAARQLDLRDVGFELDGDAARTSHAAGHPVIQCDVTQYPTTPLIGRTVGVKGSPVCTPYSQAGGRKGLIDMPHVHQAIHDLAHGRDTRAELAAACKDEKSILAAEPMRWLYDLRPEWVCLEQVPGVLPLWQQYAGLLRDWGYSAWVGVLNAADYGVPQTRKRAILIASRVRRVTAPEPTHTEKPLLDLFGVCLDKWVSMADALGLPPAVTVNTRGDRPKDAKGRAAGGNEFSADGPSNALTGRARSWVLRSGQSVAGVGRAERSLERPAFTITSRADLCKWVGDDTERPLSVEEAAVLQTFRADYPLHGTRTSQFRQVGNAVPRLLALHVLSAATGIPVPAAAPFEVAA